MIYKTSISIGDADDQPITVHYTECAFVPGNQDGPGGPRLEPDEPAHIEIEQVFDSNGIEITLTTAQEDAVLEEISLWLAGYYDQDPPERDDYA